MDFDPAWSLRPAALRLVETLIAEGRTSVVECGSGLSTVTIARALRAQDAGHVHSLEHDAHWAARTRQALAGDGLTGFVTLLEAPLVDGWYDPAALGHLPERGIDLLLVDGPPQAHGSRYPALPELSSRLAPGAPILLDDADRPDEQRTLDRWVAEFPLRLRPAPPRTALALYIPPGFQGSDPNKNRRGRYERNS